MVEKTGEQYPNSIEVINRPVGRDSFGNPLTEQNPIINPRNPFEIGILNNLDPTKPIVSASSEVIDENIEKSLDLDILGTTTLDGNSGEIKLAAPRTGRSIMPASDKIIRFLVENDGKVVVSYSTRIGLAKASFEDSDSVILPNIGIATIVRGENNKIESFVLSQPKLKDSLSNMEVDKKVLSDKEILEEVRKDFPWFTDEELTKNPYINTIIENINNRNLEGGRKFFTGTEKDRITALLGDTYGDYVISQFEMGQDVDEGMLKYLAAREYSRAYKMAELTMHDDSTSKEKLETLAQSNPGFERMKKVSEFEKKLEQSALGHLEKVLDLEKKLLNIDRSERLKKITKNISSGSTSKVENLFGSLSHSRSGAIEMRVITDIYEEWKKQGRSNEEIWKELTVTVAHEYMHTDSVQRQKNPDWQYEELFTVATSEVLPYWLEGKTSPVLDIEIPNDKRLVGRIAMEAGNQKLFKLTEELIKKVESEKITLNLSEFEDFPEEVTIDRDFILRSFLFTSTTGQIHGGEYMDIVDSDGNQNRIRVVGFANLVNKLLPGYDFDQEFEAYNDEVYEESSTEIGEKNENTPSEAFAIAAKSNYEQALKVRATKFFNKKQE